MCAVSAGALCSSNIRSTGGAGGANDEQINNNTMLDRCWALICYNNINQVTSANQSSSKVDRFCFK